MERERKGEEARTLAARTLDPVVLPVLRASDTALAAVVASDDCGRSGCQLVLHSSGMK